MVSQSLRATLCAILGTRPNLFKAAPQLPFMLRPLNLQAASRVSQRSFSNSYNSSAHMSGATHWVPGNYPQARDSIDHHHITRLGEVPIPDPYQHLEDHDSPEANQFTTVQAAFTRYSDQHSNPLRIEGAFNNCSNYPKVCMMTVLLANSDHPQRVCFSFMHPSFVTTDIGSTTSVVWMPRQVN